MKVYATNIRSRQIGLSQSIRVANLQMLIVMNDLNLTKYYRMNFCAGIIAGVSVVNTSHGISIIVGMLFSGLSVTIGAYISTLIAEGLSLNIRIRYTSWMLVSIATLFTLCKMIKPFYAFEIYWWMGASAAITHIMYITHQHYGATLHFSTYLKKNTKEFIIDLIPPIMRGEIIYISSRDKYIFVKTTKGECELRMTLTEAIKKNHFPGMKIHRSHWINLKYIKEIKRDGRKWVLKLENESFPVSSALVPKVQAQVNGLL
jgi:hypothetical protein